MYFAPRSPAAGISFFKFSIVGSAILSAFGGAPARAQAVPDNKPDVKQEEGKPEAAQLMPAVRTRASTEPQGKDTVRATSTTLGKGKQALRDVPQSITVLTERLLDDRNLDTLKESLRNAAGVSFQAPEGGEEDIRLRGFSLQSTGDIFLDGMRDPAFYDRDSFAWDRLEVLRGSASMLFGRGSTGGAVNQVMKQPFLMNQHEVAVTVGNGGYLRGIGDFNVKTGDNAALRVNAMMTVAEGAGARRIDKQGLALAYRFGIGMNDEFALSSYILRNNNGIDYGLPWLARAADGSGNGLWSVDPSNDYAMASDVNKTGTTQWSGSHVHRFDGEATLKTQIRVANYTRDMRASAIRFAPAAQQPDGLAVTADTFGDATLLTRGTNNKKMDLDAVYAQSDYNARHRWLGREHNLSAGVDAARESFQNFALTPPAGTTIVKPPTTVGTPADGAWVDESLRVATMNRSFEAKALGVYAQDLLQIAPMWKLLGGLRWDKFSGSYHAITAQGQPTTGTPPVANPCYVPTDTRYSRSDSLFSHRAGVLFQPTEQQSYHLAYGTSFNTSGDAYQFDAGTARTDPESSRNVELGTKLELAGGRLSVRGALFHSTKFNERNRDAESVNACNYVLSGKRHSAGLELDLAGRISPAWEVFGSYAYVPVAKVDASSGAAGTEVVGSRPGLTPRHSGTVWSTYRVTSAWRLGAGLNARSGDRPVGLAATSTTSAPRFVTADLMAEYTLEELSLKFNLSNVTNSHYADTLYRGHYVAGKARSLQTTVAYKF